ncbi:MAG: MGMT family protein [Bacteroidota bacterium]
MPEPPRSRPVHDPSRLGAEAERTEAERTEAERTEAERTEAERTEAGDFYARVYAVVSRIPPGRVTTYGRIARYLGVPRASRAVGYALKAAAGLDPLEVPCHRVVNREGRLTGRLHFSTPTAMEERLRAEEVAFEAEDRVDLEAHLWDPGVAI